MEIVQDVHQMCPFHMPALGSSASFRKRAESLLLSGQEPWLNDFDPVV